MTPADRSRRLPGCASDLELDELLAGDLAGTPREAQLRSHAAECARCRDRLASFAAVTPPPPPAVAPPADAARAPDAPVVAGARPRGRWAAAGAAALALAGAAAVLVVFARPTAGPQQPSPEVRTKGNLALTVFVRPAAGGAVEAINGVGRLHPGDELRFSLAGAGPGHVVVLGLDGKPSVTVYVPAPASAAGAKPVALDSAAASVLPGSIVADAAPGDERIVAVVCDVAIAPEALRQRARVALATAGGRPEQVHALGTGCREASVLLQKIVPAPSVQP